MDDIKAEIENLRLAREAAHSEIVEEIKSDIDLMRETREAAYADILGGIKDLKHDSKMTKYKLTSAIKHNSHIHTTNMNQIKDEIQKLHTAPSSLVSSSTFTTGLLPVPVHHVSSISACSNNDGQPKINFS